MQGKKFISPGAWFSMNYPSDWNEFEDGEGSFFSIIPKYGREIFVYPHLKEKPVMVKMSSGRN